MPSLVGRQVGNYQVTDKIGEGGMGAVYSAVHPELGRRVAIKVIRPELARDEEVVARFLREGRAANQVRHRGLVEVLDLGRMSDGTLYLIMEMLTGESLRRRLERGPLPLVDALTIFAECAAGLCELHRAGIVHRDLKPDNIFLVGDRDGPVEVKILDFGMVKLLQPHQMAQSATGVIVGTPLYMAPEQCEGSRDIDARADIYAAGCVLHQMIAGRPPFQPDTPAKALLMHLAAPPPPLRSERADTPPAIEAAVLRALAKRPAERFATMEEFAAAVGVAVPPARRRSVSRPPTPDRVAAALPGLETTRGRSTGELIARQRRPSRRAWWLAGLLVVGLAVAATVLATSHPPEPVVTGPAAGAPAPAVSQPPATSSGPAGVEAQAAARTGLVDSCLSGSAPACENSLHALVRSRRGPAGRDRELTDLDRRCQGVGPCAVFAAWLRREPDAARSACEAGVPTGCLILGLSCTSVAEADAYFRRARETLDPTVHDDAFYLRGLMRAFGVGGERDADGARQDLGNACTAMDPGGCGALRCLDPSASTSDRMKELVRCQEDGLIDDVMVEIAKSALVREVMSKPAGSVPGKKRTWR